MGKKLDITGETYGYAKAIRNTGKQYHGSYIWEFECTLCGKRFEAKIRDVRYGSVKSCGCWHRKNLDKMDTDEKFGQIEGTNVSKIVSKKIPQNNTSGHKGCAVFSQWKRCPPSGILTGTSPAMPKCIMCPA